VFIKSIPQNYVRNNCIQNTLINVYTPFLLYEKRDSLNGHSPYKLSLLLFDKRLYESLDLKAIAPDKVMLSPNLLK